nr:MAG TPA: hypothetical protein [Caudoviricetes sp.]
MLPVCAPLATVLTSKPSDQIQFNKTSIDL